MNQGESQGQVIPPLPIYQCNQHMSRSNNLNDLIKLHRFRQKYQIVDKFFNNSYISIENRLQPIESYYYSEIFKFYLQDLALVYFKDIEFNQNVRLQFILRRLNFTLNGENFDYKHFLQDNKFYDDVMELFSDQYMDELNNTQNKRSVIDLRNSINLCYIIDAIYSYGFSYEQREEIFQKIHEVYQSIAQQINYQDDCIKHQQVSPQDSHQCFLKNISSDSVQHSECSQSINEGYFSQDTFWFDDMIYQQQIDLKLIETDIQIKYFSNRLEENEIDETNTLKYRYIIQINKEYMEKLTQLRKLNRQNRNIVKNIKKNIKMQLMTGVKCIAFEDSTDNAQCFGQINQVNTLSQLKQSKLQKIVDVDYMQNQLLKMINKLKFKLIADAIEKIFAIEKDKRKDREDNNILFSVSFQHGLGIKQAIFTESDFLMLNDIRQESTLTSYLNPMKSTYSYISHNIYTFLKILDKDFPYNKETNNNQEVITGIRQFARQDYLDQNQNQEKYQDEFKLCHNCKILCHQLFLKHCKKKFKQFKQEQSDGSDDSLYTQKNYRKAMQPHFIECQKYYCLYCIKTQFNGKIFNDKGWCPACLHNCHCNTCLRQKILKKYVELYLQIGGNKDNIKTQKQMINKMRIKDDRKDSKELDEDESKNGTQIEQRVYQSVIKKQIMKGYSADEIGLSLRHQQELIQLILKRQQVKLKHFKMQKELFREKIEFFSCGFDFNQIDEENKRILAEQQAEEEKQKELIKKKIKKKAEKKILENNGKKRKIRKIRRQQEIYYDFYRDQGDSELQSSSFHLKQRKVREKKYEPEYTF